MARQIFIVDALIVDSNGTFNHVTDYPKKFDSNNYSGDVEKARRRAEADMSDAWAAMCRVDTRQISTVVMFTADGFQIDRKSYGRFPENVPTEE